ncbi:hypothetical protein [Gilliamella sp. ESL0250]|uniref:hypothetical protein n=1 Tax=Gilliamella sp. ESL0250 TaxID=2705036 RepID=UPI001580C1E1|nr:hypothetical protein [Gilliamella sp. ESL0250]NUF50411.1 hypothetical protein [Gilliamella sp. ESL0250]
MALDFIIDFDNQQSARFTMSEDLHGKIFSTSTCWKSLKQLKKIRDYYTVNVVFNASNLAILITDLTQIMPQIENFTPELQRIIITLKQKNIKQLRVTGD